MKNDKAPQRRLARRTLLKGVGALGVAGLAAPVAAQTVKRGGTLVMTIIPEPSAMVSAFNTAAPLTVISPKMVEGLLSYDYELTPQPRLATSWKQSEDGRTIEFKLRDGVKWHDGKDFTSADVAYTLMELLKKNHPRGRGVFANLTAVDTPDKLTAILKLSEPSPAIMTALSSSESPILPRHVYEGTDPLANPANNKPVGTGPFMFSDWQRGNQIVLVRNPNYWDAGKPALDRIVVRTFTDANARAAAFEAGELDLGSTTPVPLSEVDRFRRNPKFVVEERGDELNNTLDIVECNLRGPILSKLEVRQALRHAINTEVMIRTVWYGLAKPLDGPIPSTLPKFHTTDVPRYPFDLAKANALLDGAGFPRQNGTRFKLRLDLPTINEVYQREAEFLRQSFRQVGIDLEVAISDVPAFIRKVYGEYNFDLSMIPASVTGDPTIGLQRFYDSKAAKQGVPFVNASGYSNPEMDQILAAAAIQPDAAKRRELFVKFQQIAMRDLPILPMALPINVTIAAAKVKNFMRGADGIRDPLGDCWIDA